jgi:hypothetical protein
MGGIHGPNALQISGFSNRVTLDHVGSHGAEELAQTAPEDVYSITLPQVVTKISGVCAGQRRCAVRNRRRLPESGHFARISQRGPIGPGQPQALHAEGKQESFWPDW